MTTIGVSNSSPRVREQVRVIARLRNSGTDTIRGVKVRFLAGDRQVGERTIDLPPGNSDAGVTFIPDSSGALQLQVTMDRGVATATRTLKVQGEGRVVAKAPAEARGKPADDSGQGTLPPQPVASPPLVTVPTPVPGGPRPGEKGPEDPPPPPRVSAPPPAAAPRDVSAPASRATLAEARGKPADDSGQGTLPPQPVAPPPLVTVPSPPPSGPRPGLPAAPPPPPRVSAPPPATAARAVSVPASRATPAEARGKPADDSGQGTLPPQRIPFEKPEQVKNGKELPGKEAGPPGFKDPTGGLGPNGVPDTTPWGGGGGGGKPDGGDGIEGVHEPGDMPKTPVGGGIPDPRQGKGTKTTRHGWGKDQYGAPIFKTPGERYGGTPAEAAQECFEFFFGVYQSDPDDEDPIDSMHAGETAPGEYSVELNYESGKSTSIHFFKDEKGKTKWVEMTLGVGSVQKPKPEGTSKVTESPKTIFTDPLLVMQWIKFDPPKGPRGDPQVSDPVPVKGGKAPAGPQGESGSPAKGGELVAAGARKAVAKLRFIGRKPGSGVTDPAEWQDRKIRDFSFARMKGFEVIDPVPIEASRLQGVLSKAQAGAASGAAAPSVTITSVGGAVQKLAVQDGKQGWAPLKAGDQLTQGSIIRVEGNTGGEVGFSSLKAALSLSFTKIHGGSKHTLYLVKTTAK